MNKKPKNELYWPIYKFSATSGETVIVGVVHQLLPTTREKLTSLVLDKAAHSALISGESWDPFNVELTVTAHDDLD